MNETIDRTPLTESQVWEHPPFVYEGHKWTTLGEDGEMAIMHGHGHGPVLAAAMESEFGYGCYDDLDVDDFGDAWCVFTAHRDGCDEDLDPEDQCGCDEYGWWATKVAADTPGAIPVTWWSV